MRPKIGVMRRDAERCEVRRPSCRHSEAVLTVIFCEENVIEVLLKWPTNLWPKDRYMKELGLWQVGILLLQNQIRHEKTLIISACSIAWEFHQWFGRYISCGIHSYSRLVGRGAYPLSNKCEKGYERSKGSYLSALVSSNLALVSRSVGWHNGSIVVYGQKPMTAAV